jgi:GAF domain-containing protein
VPREPPLSVEQCISPDVLDDAEYQYAETQKSRGVRSLLALPMFRGNTSIGVFALLPADVRPFTQSETERIETFADQAVIAIENTRLFEQARARRRGCASRQHWRVIGKRSPKQPQEHED